MLARCWRLQTHDRRLGKGRVHEETHCRLRLRLCLAFTDKDGGKDYTAWLYHGWLSDWDNRAFADGLTGS